MKNIPLLKDYGTCTIDENGTIKIPELLLDNLQLKGQEERTFVLLSDGRNITLVKPICILCGKRRATIQTDGIGFCKACYTKILHCKKIKNKKKDRRKWNWLYLRTIRPLLFRFKTF